MASARKVRWHALYPLIMTGLLAALTLWLARVASIEQPAQPAAPRHAPDYVVDQMDGKRFDERGKLQYSLVASRMVHFADDDSTELTNPTVLYLGRAEPLHIDARRAVSSKDGKIITLYDDVKLRREPAPGRAEMTLTTTELTVVPDDEFAHTDKPVQITQGKSVLNGTGFELNNLTAVAILKSKVHGTLQPKK